MSDCDKLYLMTKLNPIKIPEIRLQNGWLLTDAFMVYRREIKKLKELRAPAYNKITKLVDERKKEWKREEKKILTSMQEIAGLNFYQHLIDVFFVYGWRGAFSNPMVLGIHYRGTDFVDVLTHEMLHRLITDNTQHKNGGMWPTKVYPKVKDSNTIYHILVHAIHKEIYLNVLRQPDRLKRDIEKCQKWPSYKRAWQIVERDGHMNIINKFRKSKL